jgi:hypothetical protein
MPPCVGMAPISCAASPEWTEDCLKGRPAVNTHPVSCFGDRAPARVPRKLLDHLIRPLQERRRDRQAEGLGGLEVDDEVEPVKLFDGKIPGVDAQENLVDLPG